MRAATAVPGLVQRLLAHEAEHVQNQQNERELLEAFHRACEKLRVHLSTRIGRDGFRTLLIRALKLATVQFPHLSTIRIAPDGMLEGLSDNKDVPDGRGQPTEMAEGAAAILTHFFELLVTFIGEALTRRILGTLWPRMDWSGLWGSDVLGTDEKEHPSGQEAKTQ